MGVHCQGLGIFNAAHVLGHRACFPAFLLGKPVVFDVSAKYFARIDSHRTVKENWDVVQFSSRLEAMKVIQKALRSPHCKRWDNNRSSAPNRASDYLAQRYFRIHSLMA